MADARRTASDDVASGSLSAPFITSDSDNVITSTSPPQHLTSEQQRDIFGRRHIRSMQKRIAEGQRLLDAGDTAGIMKVMLSPLRAAALNADAPAISQIVQTGQDLNAKNDFGESALHLAAIQGRGSQCVRLLIAAGADVHSRNVYGDTALLYAAYANDEESVRVLLAAGANPAVTSVDGCMPYGVTSKRILRNLLR